VIVNVDVELDETFVDDVSQCEDRIVSQSRAFLSADQSQELRESMDEILRPLGVQTRLLVIERAN